MRNPDQGTQIHRIESRLILPFLSVPDPSRERYPGEAILHTILNTKNEISRSSPSTRGGSVGVHWSTDPSVPTSYFDSLLGTTQPGVALSKSDVRAMKRTRNDPDREKQLFGDLSGNVETPARRFSASVIWHGSVVDPEQAEHTQFTHEGEIDLKKGSPVAVHGFSYRIPHAGATHMSGQFTRVNLSNPIMMTVSNIPHGSSVNERVTLPPANRH